MGPFIYVPNNHHMRRPLQMGVAVYGSIGRYSPRYYVIATPHCRSNRAIRIIVIIVLVAGLRIHYCNRGIVRYKMILILHKYHRRNRKRTVRYYSKWPWNCYPMVYLLIQLPQPLYRVMCIIVMIPKKLVSFPTLGVCTYRINHPRYCLVTHWHSWIGSARRILFVQRTFQKLQH